MNPKRLTFILLGLISFLIIAGGLGFWLSHKALAEKSQALSRVIADISLVNEQLDSYTRLEQDYGQIAPLEEKVYAVLPAEKLQSEVTLQLNTIVRSVGLELSGLTFESTTGRPGERSQTLAADIPGVLVMPIQFQITSSYEDFLELLRTIENQQRYMQVSNLGISRISDDLQFNISLEVFLKP